MFARSLILLKHSTHNVIHIDAVAVKYDYVKPRPNSDSLHESVDPQVVESYWQTTPFGYNSRTVTRVGNRISTTTIEVTPFGMTKHTQTKLLWDCPHPRATATKDEMGSNKFLVTEKDGMVDFSLSTKAIKTLSKAFGEFIGTMVAKIIKAVVKK